MNIRPNMPAFRGHYRLHAGSYDDNEKLKKGFEVAQTNSYRQPATPDSVNLPEDAIEFDAFVYVHTPEWQFSKRDCDMLRAGIKASELDDSRKERLLKEIKNSRNSYAQKNGEIHIR